MNDTIILNNISDKVIVEKGNILTYSFETIPSADLNFDYSITNPGVIKFIKTESQYANKNYNPNDDGGDRLIGKHIFIANKKGESSITFTSFLHGQIEFQDTIKISVQ
ncbi:MAG: hypothetical protein JXR68_07845 [Bacteroidales bacterium]|nr:hypothetical protein [Bacteroidales bacterium]